MTEPKVYGSPEERPAVRYEDLEQSRTVRKQGDWTIEEGMAASRYDPDPLHVQDDYFMARSSYEDEQPDIARPSHLGSIVIVAAVLVLAVMAAALLLAGDWR